MSIFQKGLFGGSSSSGGGGGSGTGWDGRVDTFADLPSAAANNNKYYMVDQATGTVGIDYKSSGIYRSDGVSWTIRGTPPLTSVLIGGILVSAAALGVFGSSTIKVTPDAINGTMTIEGNYTAGNGMNITGNIVSSTDTLSTVTARGNTTTVSITTGNVTAPYFLGNGSLLTGITVTDGGVITIPCGVYATFNGGGSSLINGTHTQFYIPNICNLTSVTVGTLNTVGNVIFDIKTTDYSNYPNNFTSIVSTTPPTVTDSTKYQDTTLSGWNKTLNAGSYIDFSVIGDATNITDATIILGGTR